MRYKSLLVVFALMLAFGLSLGSTVAKAQTTTTGGVTGTVTDPSGAVVPNADVTLKSNDKGSVQTTKTNSSGLYEYFLLAPSGYTITVKATGFKDSMRTFEVPLGQPVTINVSLALAGGGTTVTVTEAAPLIQVESGNVAATLNQAQVSQVPNPGNDLSYIAQLAPGVVMNTESGFGNFSAYGLPATANLFTLDGMDDNDPFLNLNNSGATNLLLGQNEIQEATIVTNGYSGQYGGLAGANINYVTKSGGNDFHGNAVYFWNGSRLNANDFIRNAQGSPRVFSNANQWAGSFGGPIKKDKLFFFFNTEGLRVLLPTTFNVLLPSTQFQTATLANIDSIFGPTSVSDAFYKTIFSLYNGTPGASAALPGTFSGGNGCGGFTFAGVTNCVNHLTVGRSTLTYEKQYAGRADWNVGNNDRAFLRVWYDQGLQATSTDPINTLFNIQSNQPQWQGNLEETHTFGATLANQLILSGSHYVAIFDNVSRPKTLSVFPTTLSLGDGTLQELGGNIFGLGDALFPQGRNVTQAQISDDASKSWGGHTFRFGGKFRRNDVSDHDYGLFASGLLIPFTLNDFFNGGSTGDVLLQNFPTSLNQPMAIYTLGFYGEDTWKARPNLSLTLSLRAEQQSNPVCQHRCFARLATPFTQEIANNTPSALAAIPYNQSIQNNQKQDLLAYDKILWQPRFGFAWQPFGSSTGMLKSNFVVRGGIGLFYDAFPAVTVDNISSNPPQLNAFVIAFNNLAPGENCGGTCSNVFTNASTSNTAFINGFNSGQTLAQIQAADPAFSPPVLFSTDKKTRAPQFQKWNLEIQKGFGSNTSIDLNYVGNHSTFLLIDNNSINAFGFGSLPSGAPDPRFSTVHQLTNASRSNYNGLSASFNHRFTRWAKGIVQANYTYSHAFDESSNAGVTAVPFNLSAVQVPQDPRNIRGNYGPADYDARHYFNANYVLDLPIRTALRGHGSGYLVDGWEVAGAVFARSGLPYTVVDGNLDSSLSGQNYGGAVSPAFLGGSLASCGKGAVLTSPTTPCLTENGSQFSLPPTGFTPGQRNFFRAPKYFDTDFTVMKYTKLGSEKSQLGIGLQFFNFFNHPNFGLPDNNISHNVPGGTFGEITSMVSPPTSILGSFLGGDASPRMIQVKAEFKF